MKVTSFNIQTGHLIASQRFMCHEDGSQSQSNCHTRHRNTILAPSSKPTGAVPLVRVPPGKQLLCLLLSSFPLPLLSSCVSRQGFLSTPFFFFVFSSKCALSSNRNFSKLYSQPQRVKEGKVSQETPTPTSPTTQQKATTKDLCLKGSYPKASVNQILHAHGFSSIEYLPSHDKFIRRVTRTDCDKYAQIC